MWFLKLSVEALMVVLEMGVVREGGDRKMEFRKVR